MNHLFTQKQKRRSKLARLACMALIVSAMMVPRWAAAQSIKIEVWGTSAGAELVGTSLSDALSSVKIDTITELGVREGIFTADDWLYLRNSRNVMKIRHFSIDDMVDCADIPDTQDGQPFWANVEGIYIAIRPQIERIGDYAFSGLDKLEFLDIQGGVKHVGKGAFKNCSVLRGFVQPQVLSIGDNAFAGCARLQDIVLGYHPPVVGKGAFPAGCAINFETMTADSLLMAIFLYKNTDGWDDATQTWYGAKLNYHGVSKGLIVLVNDDPTPCIGMALDEVIVKSIGTSVTAALTIGDIHKLSIISGKLGLEDWLLMDAVLQITELYIGPAADANYAVCSSLPRTLKVLVDSSYSDLTTCFAGALSLERVTLATSSMIPAGAFRLCHMLKEVNLPWSSHIDDEAFAGCGELTTVNAPKVWRLTGYPFWACERLSQVNMPELMDMNYMAFGMCDGLTSIKLPKLRSFLVDNTSQIFPCSITNMHLPATPPSCIESEGYGSSAWTLRSPNFDGNYLTPRYITLIDETGAPLKGDDLDAAIAAYKADAGWDDARGQWWGWTLLDAAAQTYSISLAGQGAVVWMPHQISLANSTIEVGFRCQRHYLDTSDPTVKVYKTGDPATVVAANVDMFSQVITFTMPAYDVTVEVNYTPNVMELTVNGGAVRSGRSVEDALTGIDPLTVHSLNIIKSSTWDDDDWAYVTSNLLNLERFVMHPDVQNIRSLATSLTPLSKLLVFDAPVAMLPPQCFYTNAVCALHELNLPNVTELYDRVFCGAKFLSKVNLPNLETIEEKAFANAASNAHITLPKLKTIKMDGFGDCQAYRLSLPALEIVEEYGFSYCQSLVMLELGATPPTVADADVFQSCKKKRYLQLIDADGAPLTGNALTAAIEAYKADVGWNNVEEKWWGWTLYDASVHQIYTLSLQYDTQKAFVFVDTHHNAGDWVDGLVLPFPGFVLSEVRVYKTGDATTQVPVVLLANGDFEFVMPAYDVTVELEFDTEIYHMQIAVNGKYVCTGATLDGAIGRLGVPYNAVTSLEITKAKRFGHNYTATSDWHVISMLPNLEDLHLTERVDSVLVSFNLQSNSLRTLTVDRLPDIFGSVIANELRRVSLPQTKVIGRYVFWNFFTPHTNLSEVYLPEVSVVKEGGFKGCNLSVLNLPKADSLKFEAFAGNSNLSSVSLPRARYIEWGAFDGCTSLSFMQLGAIPPVMAKTYTSLQMFYNCPTTRYLQLVDANGVPLTGDALTTAIATYKADAGWNSIDNLWCGWTLMENVNVQTTNASICQGNAYNWAVDGKTYSQAGSYVDMTDASNPKTLMLEVVHPVYEYVATQMCQGETYDFNGSIYARSGFYIDTLVAASTGCDSIVSLSLTVHKPVYHELSHSAEGSYSWFGNIYTTSGDYEHTLATAFGCDSIITLHLNITESTSPSGVRSAAVEPLSLSPNPTTGEVYVDVAQATVLRVFSVGGCLVLRQPVVEGRTRLDLAHLPAGLYIVRAGSAVAKVVKQ